MRALRGVDLDVGTRRAADDRRAVGLGQDDAAADHGHARSRDRGRGRGSTASTPRPRATTSCRRCARAGSASSSSSSTCSTACPAVDNVAGGLLYSGPAERAAPRAGARGARARRPRPPPRRTARRSSRAARSSARRSPARSSAGRRSSSPTSRPARWTRGPARSIVELLQRAQRGRHDDRRHHARHRARRLVPAPASRCATARSFATRPGRGMSAAAAPPARAGCCRATSSPSARSACARASCARRCRRSASRSGSPRWSPCSASQRVQPGRRCSTTIDALGTNLLTVQAGPVVLRRRRFALPVSGRRPHGGDDRRPGRGVAVRRRRRDRAAHELRQRVADERHHGLRRRPIAARRARRQAGLGLRSSRRAPSASPRSCSAASPRSRLGLSDVSARSRRCGSATATTRSSGSSHP